MSSAAERLLDRLERPQRTRPGAWMAGCPCCQSRRGRPIGVRELADGRVLVHAFCGCSTESVLHAIGLELKDLFDAPLVTTSLPASRVRFSPKEMLAAISEEVDIAALVAAAISDGKPVSAADMHRLATAASRIGAARAYVY